MIWVSEDAGSTWTQLPGPFPGESGGATAMTYGHGRFVVAGDPGRGVVGGPPMMCASSDAIDWDCRILDWMADLGGALYHARPEATATGFVSLLEQLPDEFTAGPNETVLITSADGLEWTGGVDLDLHNLLVYSVHPTTPDTFMLGATNPYLPEDISETRIAVHRAPLP